MNIQKTYILITTLILGFFIAIQSRSFESVSNEFQRDVKSNIFQEIRILKEKNESLRKEAKDLEDNLNQFADQNSALGAVEAEIEKYTKLSGSTPIFGPGVSVTVSGQITTPWVVDLVNALFNADSEAVSVNGIRLTNKSAGFDTLPQGQILLNGSVLSPPYVFNALGESSNIISILELPGGIYSRLTAAIPGLKIDSITKDIIQLN